MCVISASCRHLHLRQRREGEGEPARDRETVRERARESKREMCQTFFTPSSAPMWQSLHHHPHTPTSTHHHHRSSSPHTTNPPTAPNSLKPAIFVTATPAAAPQTEQQEQHKEAKPQERGKHGQPVRLSAPEHSRQRPWHRSPAPCAAARSARPALLGESYYWTPERRFSEKKKRTVTACELSGSRPNPKAERLRIYGWLILVRQTCPKV